MSQSFWSAVPPTPPAQRRAEAEAIYQLLRVVNEDLKRERALTLAGRVLGVATDRTDG